MAGYLGALTLIILIGLVICRAVLSKSRGVEAMQFGKTDRTDFLIPPFALFYIYLVFAAAFGWPSPSRQVFFDSDLVSGLGALLCFAGLVLFVWGVVSFGRNFRVGIDTGRPGNLVTTGAFARTRNPLYVAFAFILVGEFFIFPNWILLLYIPAGFWLFHRQVLREEAYLREHHGQAYREYSRRVRRYL